MKHATQIGFGAILLWSLLAVFTVGSKPVPPLQLNAMCFAIGGCVGLIWVFVSGTLNQLRTVPVHVYAIGTAGLFGYHFLYFTALRLAPPAQAGLIAYLWPLLIVLLSGLLPNEKLSKLHVVGAGLGFAGVAILMGDAWRFNSDSAFGLVVALLCAFTWAGYSVVSRTFGTIPTSSVAVFCVATAVLSAIGHAMFETTIWPNDPKTWGSILALGLGPVGAAFYLWDIGVKNGDIQFLGVCSYAAPVLSTLALVITGFADLSSALFMSLALIVGGAALAGFASTANSSTSETDV